jgi:excisionase family DNA binding protein
MLELLAFIAGAVMLVKGGFRLFNRTVHKRDGRIAGGVLMAPFIIELCVLFSLSFTLINDSMVVAEDGSVSISSQLLDEYATRVTDYSALFLALLVVAVVVVGYIIWRSPQVNAPPAPVLGDVPPQPPAPASKPPVAPAAKPAREHPLSGFGAFTPSPAKAPPAPKSIMTIAEAAAYIKQTPADIERLIDQNRLPAARGPGGYRIARSALDDYLAGEL